VNLGKKLIIIGIFVAIVPATLISIMAYLNYGQIGIFGQYGPLAFFILGIAIAIYGEYLDRR
jgi:hypothetical protein